MREDLHNKVKNERLEFISTIRMLECNLFLYQAIVKKIIIMIWTLILLSANQMNSIYQFKTHIIRNNDPV